MLSRLAIMLIEAGVVNAEEVDQISKDIGPGETELAEHLVATGRAPEELITEILADMYSVDPIYLNETRITKRIVDRIPEEMARRFILVPLDEDERLFHIAIADPGNLYAIDEVKFKTGKEVLPHASAPSAIRRTLDELYGKVDDLVSVEESLSDYDEEEDGLEVVESLEFTGEEEEEEEVVEDYASGAEDEPVIKFVNDLIVTAVRKEVSDIHVEPYERYVRVRYRQDGTCHVVGRVPKKLQAPVLSRLKILSRMNIAERRKTQDGRIKANVDGRTIDFRVSAVPAINGEKIVLRILDRGNLEFDLRQLGFPEDGLKVFMKGIGAPFGIVLVTGPTGSGKTTTLYSALSQLNRASVNIHTAEDPIEYHIEGLTQTQVDSGMGYDFAAALRAILRQDPNIIMVGEIRDFETAAIAMKASLTGHLVFSTIHTNDAPSTVNRLVDIGIKPFLVASAINVIMAQRLLRQVCRFCKEPFEYAEKDLLDAGIDPAELEGATLYDAVGCPKCNGTGYKGRMGIFEVLTMTRDLKQAVMDRAPAGKIRTTAVSEGMRTLRMDAVDKFRDGVTSLSEVTRVTAEDDVEVMRARKKYLRNKERDRTA